MCTIKIGTAKGLCHTVWKLYKKCAICTIKDEIDTIKMDMCVRERS